MRLKSSTYTQPESLAELEWWVCTARNEAGVKLPRAPYLNGASYPAEWAEDLRAERRPERALKTIEGWADLSPSELSERGCGLPSSAEDSTLRIGLILPTDRLAPEIRPVLIDWDDVRDPETGEIHPICAEYLADFGGYVSISQSGKGVHQWVFGEVPGTRKKFIKQIDTEPWVQDSDHADDNPQVEIYDGGRHVIMTGKHADGFGSDIVPGQDTLDDIVQRFTRNETGNETDDEEGRSVARTSTPSGDTDGDDVKLPLTSPEDRPLCYHRALIARRDGTAYTNNHDTNLLASNLAMNLGYSVSDALEAFKEYSGTGTTFNRKITKSALEDTKEKAESGDMNPPGTARLIEAGILPEAGCDSDCPIHGDRERAKHVPILPEVEQEGADGWGSLNPERVDSADGITKAEARARTASAIEGAASSRTNSLIDGLPTLGKSYGAVRAVAEADVQATIFTNRGRKEQYEQYTEWAEARGLSVQTLPSVWKTCQCFKGEYGRDVADLVRRWYRRGATGKEIHVLYEAATGEQIPCEGPAGDRCGFKAAWQADFEEYDLLLGSYVHAYVNSAVNGRTVFIDEYPRSSFETTLEGKRLTRAVSTYLKHTPAIPFDSFTDVLEHRADDERRTDALEYLEGVGTESNGEEAILRDDGHADSIAAVWVLLASVGERGVQYENEFERASLPGSGGDVALYDRRETAIHLLRKPNFEYASAVIALDGTPAPRLWETVQHKRLEHTRILSDDERREYLSDCLGLTFVQTSDAMKPYNTAENVYSEEDAALLEGVTENHDRPPALITTQTAEAEHESAGVYRRDDDGGLSDGRGRVQSLAHYGNLKGSNRFADERLGAVIGSNHFGDREVMKQAAFAGADVSRVDDTYGVNLEYEEANPSPALEGIGNAIHRDMTHGETLQAALRFGRDGNGATVYLHTAAIPPLLEDSDLLLHGEIITVYSDEKRRVIETLADMDLFDGFTTSRQVHTESETDLSLRQIRTILTELEEDGYLEADRSRGPSRGVLWFDPSGSLESVGGFGRSKLPEPKPKVPALSDAPESRSYRWTFRSRTEALEVPGEPEARLISAEVLD